MYFCPHVISKIIYIKLIQLDSELGSVTYSTVKFSFVLFPSILPSFLFSGHFNLNIIVFK